MVLVPYKITLLSNTLFKGIEVIIVLVPYKITLLSNLDLLTVMSFWVLVPYKITLLSNSKRRFALGNASFSTL